MYTDLELCVFAFKVDIFMEHINLLEENKTHDICFVFIAGAQEKNRIKTKHKQ